MSSTAFSNSYSSLTINWPRPNDAPNGQGPPSCITDYFVDVFSVDMSLKLGSRHIPLTLSSDLDLRGPFSVSLSAATVAAWAHQHIHIYMIKVTGMLHAADSAASCGRVASERQHRMLYFHQFVRLIPKTLVVNEHVQHEAQLVGRVTLAALAPVIITTGRGLCWNWKISTPGVTTCWCCGAPAQSRAVVAAAA